MRRNIFTATVIMLLCLAALPLFPQMPRRSVDLRSQEPSWQAVIGGNAVSPCIETSYGVALLSDGRLLSACTSSGTVIWQKSVKGRPSPYLASFGDFLYVVTDSSHLNLVNPSGVTLWTAVCPFGIEDFPLVGRDGRVFVRGKRGLACYGLDGKRKWRADTPELAQLPVCSLDDGSILVFLKAPKEGRTVANHYSPFGEKLEDITFSGIVASAESCDRGALVSLANGSVGLVSIKDDGTAGSVWVNGSGNPSGAFKISVSAVTGNAAFFFQNGARTEALIVRTEDGFLLNRFQVGQIASSDFKIAKPTRAGFFISGAYAACEFGEDGTIFYAALLPPSAKWSSIFYTEQNHIILCMKDWTMKGFRMSQTTGNAVSGVKKDARPISYVSRIDLDPELLESGVRPLSDRRMAEISRALAAGDYGPREREYLSLIKTEAENYVGVHSMRPSPQGGGRISFFAENPVYTQNLLYLMSRTGTREFSLYFARLLSEKDDDGQLLSVIAFAGDCAYDEDGEILAALEALLLSKVQPSQAAVLKEICDTTYKICSFMGRPTLNRQGKGIISRMLMPQYDKTTNSYARKTLEKLAAAERK